MKVLYSNCYEPHKYNVTCVIIRNRKIRTFHMSHQFKLPTINTILVCVAISVQLAKIEGNAIRFAEIVSATRCKSIAQAWARVDSLARPVISREMAFDIEHLFCKRERTIRAKVIIHNRNIHYRASRETRSLLRIREWNVIYIYSA